MEFKYLGKMLHKHENMNGEIRESAVSGRQVTEFLGRNMKSRSKGREVSPSIAAQ